MIITSINEYKRYLLLKENNRTNPIIGRPQNIKYTVIFFDYPEFVVLKGVDGKYYVYTYDQHNEDIYSEFIPEQITGIEPEGLNYETNKLTLSELDDTDDIIENYINYHDFELSEFEDEFDKSDALYLIDDRVLTELYEYYKGIPFFKGQLDQIKDQIIK